MVSPIDAPDKSWEARQLLPRYSKRFAERDAELDPRNGVSDCFDAFDVQKYLQKKCAQWELMFVTQSEQYKVFCERVELIEKQIGHATCRSCEQLPICDRLQCLEKLVDDHVEKTMYGRACSGDDFPVAESQAMQRPTSQQYFYLTERLAEIEKLIAVPDEAATHHRLESIERLLVQSVEALHEQVDDLEATLAEHSKSIGEHKHVEEEVHGLRYQIQDLEELVGDSTHRPAWWEMLDDTKRVIGVEQHSG